jgi:hypothetical protein
MFPFFDNLGFWAFTGIVSLLAYFLMRRHVRQQLPTAPKASLRSPRQRLMHWSSLLLLALPLGYVILVNDKPFWAVFCVLWVQAGSMLALRLVGVRFTVRVWLLIPVAVASLFFGAVATVWPSVNSSALREAPWPFLFITTVAFALSSLISMYSFPLGYGERSR